MKVGIVTIMDDTNYGNRLQNYALSYLLRTKFGCKAVTLKVNKGKSFEDGNYVLWLKNQIAKKCCVFPSLAERKWGAGMTRWANFRNWSKRHIPTKNIYGHKHLPESLNEEFDFFFAGSDQIWNHRFPAFRCEDYFLKFAEDRKRVSVAASFGVEEIQEEWRKTYVDGLSGFAHISVREDAGQAIVKDLLNRDVPVLVDPTMMLSPEEWLKVAKKPRVDTNKPYILKYYLGNEADNLDAWAKENGYEVYELLNGKIPELYSVGPGEFITLIQNASLVCSDSFHCIVFSIIFSRPFVVCARQGREDYMASRLTTLLGKFGFQNRWKHLLSPEEYLECDFTHVKPLMEQEQQKFLDYVGNILRTR